MIVFLEVLRNWYMIAVRRKSPHHKGAMMLRLIVALIFWIVTPVVYPELPWDSWLAMPVMMSFIFWWMFDSVLNLMRGLPIYHLDVKDDPEEDSLIDSIQTRTFGEWPWFWFKLILAGASVTTFYYGWNAVLGIS